MHELVKKQLACPVCHGPLTEDGLGCQACGLRFSEYQGIPCLFGPEKEDLWAQNQSGLAKLLAENPETAQKLENSPEEALNGADTFAKAALRKEQGRYLEAIALQRAAWQKSYPPEYIACFQAQLDFIAQSLAWVSGPIVDIASGRGMLISRLQKGTAAPLVATDLSPFVLANSLAPLWPEELARGRLSMLAFDATAMPFQDKSLPVLTTCLGLQNIPNPQLAAKELRRVCAGKLYALCQFFPEDDEKNQQAAARFGLAGAYAQSFLAAMMEEAGWRVSFHNGPWLRQPPTPVGQVAPGLHVDGLPVEETLGRVATMICE